MHTVPVVKEELFSWFNAPLGKYSNPVVPIHHQHFSKAVRVNGVVGKPNLVAFTSGIHHIVCIGVCVCVCVCVCVSVCGCVCVTNRG